MSNRYQNCCHFIFSWSTNWFQLRLFPHNKRIQSFGGSLVIRAEAVIDLHTAGNEALRLKRLLSFLSSSCSHSASAATWACQYVHLWVCVCVFALVSFLSAQLNSCHFPFTITGTYSLTSTVLKHSRSRSLSLGGGAPPCIACGAADVYCSCLFASVSPPLGSFVHPFLSRPHSSCRLLPSFRFQFLSSAPFPLFD